jgi:hypothetical protein
MILRTHLAGLLMQAADGSLTVPPTLTSTPGSSRRRR